MKQGQTHTIQIHSIHNKEMQSLIRQYAVILNQGEVKKDEYAKIIRPAINHNNNNKKNTYNYHSKKWRQLAITLSSVIIIIKNNNNNDSISMIIKPLNIITIKINIVIKLDVSTFT